MAEFLVTEAEQGERFAPRVGDEILLQLPENPSTGYRWAIDRLDEDRVNLVDSGFRAEGPATGSGGAAFWRLRMQNAGRTRIELKRWRAFEGETSVVERFAFDLEIEPGSP